MAYDPFLIQLSTVEVTVTDDCLNVEDFNGTVSITLDSSPAGAVLTGTTDVSAISGVATFTDLWVNKVGTYTLKATATTPYGSKEAVSDSFDVAQETNDLIFEVQPSNTDTNTVITPSVEVVAVDTLNQIVESYTNEVDITLAGTGVLSGTLSKNAVNGIAVFDDLEIDTPGTGNVLFADDDVLSITKASNSFDITAGLMDLFPGFQWGTTFEEGVDSQVLYNVFDGTTVGTGTGQLGTTTGSDADDPTFENYGMKFDANHFVKDIGSDGQFDFICTSLTPWSIHFRVEVDMSLSGNYAVLFSNSIVNIYVSKTFGIMRIDGWAVSWNPEYPPGVSTTKWLTLSFVCDGAGNVEAYSDGVSLGVSSVGPVAGANKKGRIQQVEGLEGAAYVGGLPMHMRALAICNATHNATQVGDIHTFMSSLPNAS